jgi:glycosyltransferase involved in cell wall biosynthesis
VSVPSVSVIVPTQGASERASLLLRALDTISSQEGVKPVAIVVVNGSRWDRAIVDTLRHRDGVVTIVRDEPSLPEALRIGHSHVATEWFSELDDDDELLPGALQLRVRTLANDPDAAAVVTNGLCRTGGIDTLHLDDMAEVAVDPLRALTRINWLLPGSWLARTDRVPATLFDGVPRFLECTYLAARLASETSLRFIGRPTVVYRTDTPDSESKSLDYVIGQAAALRRLLALDLPPDVRRVFEARLAPACHNAARALAREGQTRGAWRWHLKALAQPGGWRFLLHTATASQRGVR